MPQHVQARAQALAPPRPPAEQRPWDGLAAATATAADAAAPGWCQLPVPGSSALPTHPPPPGLRGLCVSRW